MQSPLDKDFLEKLNQNIGVAHKVCAIYFSASDEREDVFQDMMYQLCRSYPRFQGTAKFSTWMYRVCLNTALTSLRKNKHKESGPITYEHQQIADEGSDPQHESMKQLLEAIERLSPINKAVILLYLEDFRYEEIANITGLTKSNVSVRLVRIKKELESQLVKRTNTTNKATHG